MLVARGEDRHMPTSPRIYVKACINGARTPDQHPNLPVAPEQLAAGAVAAHGAGAKAVHMHPKTADGLLSQVMAAGSRAPVLLHGLDESCWPLLEHAGVRGVQTRIGMEDTLHLPDGSTAVDNAALVSAAVHLLSR